MLASFDVVVGAAQVHSASVGEALSAGTSSSDVAPTSFDLKVGFTQSFVHVGHLLLWEVVS
eukprot:10574217-Prorocentrum_lima.AAC.1